VSSELHRLDAGRGDVVGIALSSSEVVHEESEAVAPVQGGGLSHGGEEEGRDHAAAARSSNHSVISDSSHATAFVEMRRLRGNSPRRSMRQRVTRDKPVICLTSGSRTKRSGIRGTPMVFGEQSPEGKECRSAESELVRKCGNYGRCAGLSVVLPFGCIARVSGRGDCACVRVGLSIKAYFLQNRVRHSQECPIHKTHRHEHSLIANP